jgi:hypothetical protein
MYAACAFGASNQPAQFLVNALSTEVAVCSVASNVFTRGSNGVLLNGQPATAPVTFSGNCLYPISAASAGVTCQLSYNPASSNIAAESGSIPTAMSSGTQLLAPNVASLRSYLSNVGSNPSADDALLTRQFGASVVALQPSAQASNLLSAARGIPAPASATPAYAPAITVPSAMNPPLTIKSMSSLTIPSVYSALGPFNVSPLLFQSSSNLNAAVVVASGSNVSGSNVSGSNVSASNLTKLILGLDSTASSDSWTTSFDKIFTWPPRWWVVAIIVLAIGAGIMFAMSSSKPKPTSLSAYPNMGMGVGTAPGNINAMYEPSMFNQLKRT